MPAIGFGQRVTGGGASPAQIIVNAVGNSGAGTLAKAISTANSASTQAAGYPPQEIVIRLPANTTTILPNTTPLAITARNLTIRAEGGAVINRNNLVFDCRGADNVILRNLRFTSDGESNPRDCINIDGTVGRGATGFWIDHCLFEAYYDLSITTNTRDITGAPPLLITISSCRFHDASPSGTLHRNHGGIGIHGYGNAPIDKRSNTYATVCRNVFNQVRRRSPRSSHLTVVHAFNNVLLEWGSDNASDDQQNGMEAGHFGILLAGANYFKPNVLNETISVAGAAAPARLTVGSGARVNQYVAPATAAVPQGTHINRVQIYEDGLSAAGRQIPFTIPIADPMTDALRATIESEAGPTA